MQQCQSGSDHVASLRPAGAARLFAHLSGVILFITNLGKLTRDSPFSVEMLGFLRGVAMRRASAPYLHFLQHTPLYSVTW